MKKRFLSAGIAVGLLIVAGVFYQRMRNPWPVLEQSDQFTLYSIEPMSNWLNLNTPKVLDSKLVLGKTVVTDPQIKHALVKALYDVCENNPRGGAGCFYPRHGLRVTRGGRTVDVLICFSCRHAYFYENGRRQHFVITKEPRELFNKVLTDAGVPLSHSPGADD